MDGFDSLLGNRILQTGWLNNYLKYTSDQESPTVFHMWTGLTIMSAALRRRVWLDWNFYKIYPNLYVALIAISAESKKTTAANIGVNLLRQIGMFRELKGKVCIIQPKTTPEGLIMRMQRADWDDETGRALPDGSVFVYAPELKVFLSESGARDLIPLLTDLYGCPDDWTYTTRARETEEVSNAYPVFLACSNPKWYAQCISEDAQAGGFTGRIVHVVAKSNKRVWKPSKDTELEAKLIHDLAFIATMRGEMTLTSEADAFCKAWYDEYKAPMSPDLESFYARYPEHMLRIAMLLAISERHSMVIEVPQIEAALGALQQIEPQMAQAFEHVGSTKEASIGEKILLVLENAGGWVAHSILLRRMYKYVKNADEFQDIIQTLLIQKIVLAAQKPGGSSMFYALPRWRASEVYITEHAKRGEKKVVVEEPA